MGWSARLWFVAFFASLQLAFMGCGSSYPRVRGQMDAGFAQRTRHVGTVDILPLDVQLWTYPGNRMHPEVLGESMHALTSGAVLAELTSRGYDVVAQMDWDGGYRTNAGTEGRAMAPVEVDGTVYALSSYGHAVAASGETLVPPYLPALLGQETRSDATLYVGGWSYVGDDHKESKGAKIAKGVLIGLIVVALVIVVIAAAKSKGGGLDKLGGGAGRAASGAGRAAGRVAVTAGRTVGRVSGTMLRGVARSGPDILRVVGHTADALGRADTHIVIAPGRPDYFREDRAPKKGKSQMYLEMTLVDNASGLVLWHARQNFPANGARSEDVRRAVARMFESLPAY